MPSLKAHPFVWDSGGIKCCGVNLTWDSRLTRPFVSLCESLPEWSGTREAIQSVVPDDLQNEFTPLVAHLRSVSGADLMADFFEREALV